MFCRHCGKEISDEAFMCPSCGTPTTTERKSAREEVPAEENRGGANLKGLAVIAFTFAAVAFVTGIVFGAFFFVFSASALLLYIIGASTILPALAGTALGIYVLNAKATENDRVSKPLSIVGIVMGGFTLLFLFIAGCVVIGIV